MLRMVKKECLVCRLVKDQKKGKNKNEICCNDGDSNPDLEHGKLEFYP